MISRTLEIGKKVFLKKGLPAHIVLFVTNKCNMECDHCFLVENGELNDLSREQIFSLKNIQKLARSLPKLLALSLTGGDPIPIFILLKFSVCTLLIISFKPLCPPELPFLLNLILPRGRSISSNIIKI